jgi:hypothetical protein
MTAVTIALEMDDHGHATLHVHGEPEIIQEVATAVTLLLAAEADHVIIPSLDEGDEEDEDLASSS